MPQQRKQVQRTGDDVDSAGLNELLLVPVTPEDADRGDVVDPRPGDVMPTVSDHDGTCSAGDAASGVQILQGMGDDVLLELARTGKLGATDERQVSVKVEMLEDARRRRGRLGRGNRKRHTTVRQFRQHVGNPLIHRVLEQPDVVIPLPVLCYRPGGGRRIQAVVQPEGLLQRWT